MTTKARYNEVKMLVRKCISLGMKKPEIIAKVKEQLNFRIIPATYPRIVNSIREDQATDNLSLDLEIQSRWDLLEKVINKDLQTDNVKDRASVLRNAITLNKEKLEFYMKTGKIEKATDRIEIEHSGTISLRDKMKAINEYILDKDKPQAE